MFKNKKRKLTVEIPEWANGRNLYIFAGIESMAEKRWDEDFIRVKKIRCNMCGKCCMDIQNPDSHVYPVIDKKCVHLILSGTEYLCKLGVHRPFSCSIDPLRQSYCCIEYEKIKW